MAGIILASFIAHRFTKVVGGLQEAPADRGALRLTTVGGHGEEEGTGGQGEDGGKRGDRGAGRGWEVKGAG